MEPCTLQAETGQQDKWFSAWTGSDSHLRLFKSLGFVWGVADTEDLLGG
jgi:hypothetical protein